MDLARWVPWGSGQKPCGEYGNGRLVEERKEI